MKTAVIKTEIAVVGGGIVGLSCALALAQADCDVVLIAEQLPLLSSPALHTPFETKVVALTRASEIFLTNLGVWEEITRTRISPYYEMRVWDQLAHGQIHFLAEEFFESNLGYIVEQRMIIRALWLALTRLNKAKIVLNRVETIERATHQVLLKLKEGQKIEAQLVIGADGAHSVVRQACEILLEKKTYQQSAVVATIKGEKTHNATAFQRFSPEGPLALLPLASSFHSSIVWTNSPARATYLTQLSDVKFNEMLTRESEAVMGKLQVVSERHVFPLTAQHAKEYSVTRSVLVGDAAHVWHPLAGQGVNFGLLDAATLVEMLLALPRQRRDYGALAILKRYERTRRWHNQSMLWAMRIFQMSFQSPFPAIQFFRNEGLRWVDKNKRLKRWFVEIALGKKGPIPLLAKVKKG